MSDNQKIKLTEEQQQLLKATGRIVVTASAGSGKTTMMVQKMIAALKADVEPDEILAITFTKKAAENMRVKIKEKMIETVNAEANEALAKKLARLPLAEISTIDAFCLRLVKKYFYETEVGASFSLADSSSPELTEIKNRTLDALFEELYKTDDTEFSELLQGFWANRSDRILREFILDQYEKIRQSDECESVFYPSEKSGEELLCRTMERFNGYVKLRLQNFERQKQKLDEKLTLVQVNQPKKALDFLIKTQNCYTERLQEAKLFDCDGIQSLYGAFRAENCKLPTYTAALKLLFSEDTESALWVDSARTFANQIKNWRDSLKKLVLTEGATFTRDQSDAKTVARYGYLLGRLMGRFDALYQKAKQAAAIYDYYDVETFTCQLLEKPEVLSQLKAKYRYVYVDEYQDVNPMQERFIRKICGENVFLVGDTKQAIYGFRGSSSAFFVQKIEEYVKNNDSVCILSSNFRSADLILKDVNKTFCELMTKERCNVDYKKTSMMQKGALCPEESGSVYYHLCEEEKRTRAEKQTPDGIYSVMADAPRQSEADYKASIRRILKIIDSEVGKSYPSLHGDGKQKKITYGDIAVLYDRTSADVTALMRALVEQGYPVTSSAAVNICDYYEVKLVLSFLQLIDCKEQDIPLTTALLSSVGGLNEADLATIRIRFPDEVTFRAAASRYAEEEQNVLSQKLNAFFAALTRWRHFAVAHSAGETVGMLLAEGLESDYLKLGQAKQRAARVRFLMAFAAKNDEYCSVHDFLCKVEDKRFEIEYSEKAGGDAIRVMTMHSSKGLEFPVVILPFLNHKKKRMSAEVFYASECGILPMIFERERLIKRTALVSKIESLLYARSQIKDRLNLLYVAMTRAEHSLHLVFSAKPEYQPDEAECFADFYQSEEIEWTCDEPSAQSSGSAVADSIGEIKPLAIGEYAGKEATGLTVKTSATAIMKRRDEGDYTYRVDDFYGIAADAETGTAYHAFLERCDFGRGIGQYDEVKSLLGEQSALIDKAQIERILSIPIFSRLSGWNIRREQSFLAKFTPYELYPDREEYKGLTDTLVLQGAIDLIAKKGDEVIIVDYKFSKNADTESLKNHYLPQMRIYRKVASKVYRLPETHIKVYIVNILSCKEMQVF